MFRKSTKTSSEPDETRALKPTGVSLTRLWGAIVIVQLAFWLVVNPVFFNGQKPVKDFAIELSNFSAAPLMSPDDAGLEAADFKPIDGPGWWTCCEPGYWAIRYTFDLQSVPREGLGYIHQAAADNIAVRVNGNLVLTRGRMALPDITYDANVKQVEYISPAALKAGTNEVTYILVRSWLPYFDLYSPILGPYSSIDQAFAWQNFMRNDFRTGMVAIGFALSLFLLVVVVQSNDKWLPASLLALVLAWTLRTHFYVWTDLPFSGELRTIYYFALMAFIPIAWLNFANEWTQAPFVSLRWVAGLTFPVLAGACTFGLLALPSGTGFDFANALLDIAGGVIMGLTVLLLGWHFLTRRDQRYWEVALLVLLSMLVILELGADLLFHRSSSYMTNSPPILLLALTVAFFYRSVRLFRSADQIAEELSGRLAVREAELETVHKREQGFVRQRAHQEERQRILRDMHDGLGSQLMSMLLAARRGDAQPDVVADGLQSVIDEMRLIIESMDSVGESLFAALVQFRDRVTPRVRAAGFEFNWENTFGDDFPDLGPRPTLQVFRILQEAVTNAMKHSGGTKVSVLISPNGQDAAHPRITISDNGVGMPDAPEEGRGLANMRKRAASIGARLEYKSSANGHKVILDLRPFDQAPIS